MKQFLIALFWLSSLLFSACKISQYNKLSYDKIVFLDSDAQPVLTSAKNQKYNTTIDVLKNHLSGILVSKLYGDSALRLVYVNEFGMKYFDMEFIGHKTILHYVFEPLNKKAIVSSLERNFRNMFLFPLYNHHAGKHSQKDSAHTYGFFDKKTKQYVNVNVNKEIYLQECFEGKKLHSKITYQYNKDLRKYNYIHCEQKGIIPFYFELTLIPDSNGN
jgi:hypothetical protein